MINALWLIPAMLWIPAGMVVLFIEWALFDRPEGFGDWVVVTTITFLNWPFVLVTQIFRHTFTICINYKQFRKWKETQDDKCTTKHH